jgi:hypothetical protein
VVCKGCGECLGAWQTLPSLYRRLYFFIAQNAAE